MKHFQKIAAVILTLLLMLTAAVPAAAADRDGTVIRIPCNITQNCGNQDIGCIYSRLCRLVNNIGCKCIPKQTPTAQIPNDAASAPTEIPTEAPTQAPTVPEPTAAPADNNYTLSAYEKEVIALTNQYREQYGLSPLTADKKLCELARMKSQDMRDKGYFDHTSPTYGTPFEMLKRYGVSYRAAGENIAMGYRTAASVVEGWMNSPGHRANILNASFTKIGVGYIADGNYCTQMFIG